MMLFAGDVVSATSAREKGYKLVEKKTKGCRDNSYLIVFASTSRPEPTL
jgi:hypothetical protein